MFKKENTPEIAVSAVGTTTIISSGTTLTGDIQSEHAMRVDGKIEGDITCTEKVIVGPEGEVRGEIVAGQAIVMGTVVGNIKTHGSLILQGKAKVQGDLFTKMLTIEPEVTFNGQCHMDKAPEKVNAGRTSLNPLAKLMTQERKVTEQAEKI
ncbi:MAG TPA: polymer-forming cytoskeletal protein [Phnomibacter sp.]|nr:polymer-forming cytoskeletal protein [Phnomibacter sp.]